MKVVLLNGSPNAKGCTYTALSEVAGEIEKAGIETEILQLGNKPVRGCIACGGCAKTMPRRCVFNDDPANAVIEAINEADGVIIGSPVYYAGPNGALCAILDRAFYASSSSFAYKPGAAIASCRRGGSSATLDRLNKYFTIAKMPVVSSQYWNMVHGNSAEEVKQDLEGMQIMRTLGKNMAWMLESIHHDGGVAKPEREKRVSTNFIR